MDTNNYKQANGMVNIPKGSIQPPKSSNPMYLRV